MGDASIKGRSPLLKGGRVGLRQGGGLPYLTRGWSRPGGHKTPRGKQHMAEIIKQGPKVVKGKANPLRMDQAQRLKAHRLRTKIEKRRAGRKEAAEHGARTAAHYAKYPGAKELYAKQKYAKSFRRKGIR